MERGVAKVIGGDPKGNTFLYTNGKCVIIRNIEVMFIFLYLCQSESRLDGVLLPTISRFPPQECYDFVG